MGGYMFNIEGNYKPISAENSIKWQRRGIVTVARCPETIMGKASAHSVGAVVELVPLPKLTKAHGFHHEGCPLELPWISQEDINARLKADVFLKGIACAQIGWLLVQFIARRVLSLPTSSLETRTVAYVVCALFSYCAWWKKPYDLESPIAIAISSDHEISSLLESAPSQIPMNDDPDLPLLHDVLWTYIMPCTAAVLAFSSLHFLAWNDQFNTPTEEWLWRICSISFVWFHVVFLGFAAHMEMNMDKPPTAANIAKIGNCAEIKAIWYVLRGLHHLLRGQWTALDKATEVLLHNCEPECTPGGPLIVFFCTHTLFYFLGRFYVLIEAFVAFRKGPAGLYDTVDWTKFIPHVH
ncbi:hypothetical protein LTR10_003522 [Elasticomyces elasticus]|nr:hypothetical protein LTR10_003522 [Elasticomyces elasticus]KAK4978283.1 hypothetical protein LTR42_002661 [Elasticomyces elasticus]